VASLRRTVTAAAATAATSFSLYPVYAGSAWWFAGAGATASVAAAGLLTRRRRLPAAVCLLGGLAALLLYLNLVFAGGRSLAAVIPTPSSLGFLARLASQGVSEAGRYAPPAPEQAGLMLLAAGGIGLTALLADLIAVRLGRAALAGLPLLLLFAEPFTLSISRGPVGTAAVFCLATAGYLTLLATEGGERIRAWESPLPGQGPEGGLRRIDVSGTGLAPARGRAGVLYRIRPPDTRALTAAGRRAGVVSVAAALCVPLFIPGLHLTRLFGGGRPGAGGDSGASPGFPDPRTQISGELRSQRAVPVLTYTTTADDPDYLRVYVLGGLTGLGWQIGRPDPEAAGNGVALRAPGLASAAAPAVTTRISVSRQTGPDALGALPAPYPPVRVTAPGTVRADRGTLMLFDRGVPLPGLRYSVTSLDVSPAPAALAAAPGPPKSVAAGYLGLPPSAGALRPLARRITRTATTPYGRAVSLQRWFTGGNFAYSLTASAVTDTASLENFLENTRTGYCQQFAYAMAFLARLDGIPSRVVYGFTQGTRQRDGSWLVTTHDAHAWPELYFAGYGWLRFEPTPGGSDGQGTAVAPAYAAAQPGPASLSQRTTGPSPSSLAGPGSGANPGGQGTLPGVRRPPGPGSPGAAARPARPPAGASPWPLAGLSAAGLLIVAAALPALARAAIRRRRWRRAASDTALAEAAWRELRDDLTNYRASGRASESPRSLARRVTAELGLPGGAASALRRVTEAAERARYSARPAEGTALRRDCETVRRAIAAAVPRRRRWRARLFPSSVTAAVSARAWRKKDRLPLCRVRLSRGVPKRDRRGPSAVRP